MGIVDFSLKAILFVIFAPFILVFLVPIIIVLAFFIPERASSKIIADLSFRIFDKVLWPHSQEVIHTTAKRR